MMNRSAKIAVVGITAGILVVIVGAIRTRHLEQQEAVLADECASTPAARAHVGGQNPFDQFDKPTESTVAPPLPPGYKLDPLVCDVQTLIQLGADTGIQGRLVDAHWTTEASREMPVFLASLIAGVSLIPWAWYFLLRRVAELRAAVSGRAPKG